jgi:hypothetical protein
MAVRQDHLDPIKVMGRSSGKLLSHLLGADGLLRGALLHKRPCVSSQNTTQSTPGPGLDSLRLHHHSCHHHHHHQHDPVVAEQYMKSWTSFEHHYLTWL